MNVLGSGTAIFLLKKASDKNLSYVTVMMVAMFFSTISILPFAMYRYFLHPVIFTQSVGLFYYAVSIIFNVLGFFCFIKAISMNELSIFGPLETTRPFFVVFLSLLLFHEQPTIAILIGTICIVIGAVILQFQKNPRLFFEKLFQSAAPLFILASAVCFAITSVLDKHALYFIDPFIYSFLITLGVCIGFIVLNLLTLQKIRVQTFFNTKLALSGFSLTFGQLAIYSALRLASANVVSPVQMTRSLYLSFLGFVVLKEKDYLKKILAALLMLLGVFFITR